MTQQLYQPSLFEPALRLREEYRVDLRRREVIRTVRGLDWSMDSSVRMAENVVRKASPFELYDASWLRLPTAPAGEGRYGKLRTVDLFSGCGAMTLGAAEAARAMGRAVVPLLAVDTNPSALAVYRHNFPESTTMATSVSEILDRGPGERTSPAERKLCRLVGDVDLLLGGPPCQGNSDLNNHTRRRDPKNALYMTMARFAEIVRPRNLLIENVPGVIHDRGKVVARTSEHLARLGYHVSQHLLDASAYGVAQNRRRLFLAASLDNYLPAEVLDALRLVNPRPLSWAIGDLLQAAEPEGDTYNSAAQHWADNQERIQYLFKHDLHDLPNDKRPRCHRTKRHSYNSVYGRMYWERPTQTITTGFGSTGQGRYVHPMRPRTMTPHEAARVQFIPDFFTFPETRRRSLQEMIGNAVPPKLAYVMTLLVLAH